MPLPVSVKAIAEELQIQPDGWWTYLNRVTGELITVNSEDMEYVELETPLDELAEWEQENVRAAEAALTSDDYLQLPTKFDIHEYAIMRDFCWSVSNQRVQNELLNKISGSGAFRRFKDTIHRRGLEDDWYTYRDAAYAAIVVEWLEENEIPYTRP